jgi:hypothetical protein
MRGVHSWGFGDGRVAASNMMLDPSTVSTPHSPSNDQKVQLNVSLIVLGCTTAIESDDVGCIGPVYSGVPGPGGVVNEQKWTLG